MDQETRTSAFDYQELLDRCLGNMEFAERVLAKFQSRFDADLAELGRALDAEDADAVARVAHRLKGASATAAAAGIRNRASEIEDLAREHRVHEIPDRLRELHDERSRFSESVSSFSRPTSDNPTCRGG